MGKPSVLVVEDEESIRELVTYTLRKEGYQAVGAASGEKALALAQVQPPDLVLLDLMLPGIDGLSVCRRLRQNPATAGVPIIMLTAKGEEADIVTGLNSGASDYITKPFSRNVLLARVRAVLRDKAARAEKGVRTIFPEESGVAISPTLREKSSDPFSDEPVRFGSLLIHPGRHAVLVDDSPVELSATEFRVLLALARRPGWVLTREQILDAVHGDNYAITHRAVDVQIVGLRRKLGAAGERIETVRGVGYRFKE